VVLTTEDFTAEHAEFAEIQPALLFFWALSAYSAVKSF